MQGFSWPKVASACLLLGACQSSPALNSAHAAPMSEHYQTLGKDQGLSAPASSDCYSHCEQAWQQEPDSKDASEADMRAYGFGCVSRCVLSRSDRAGIQCYEAMAADSAAEWQELYLARGLVEKTAYCIRAEGDTSAAGQALLSAVAQERATTASKKAVQSEREALLTGNQSDAQTARKDRRRANDSEAFKQALSAYQRWNVPTDLTERMFNCLESLPLRACGQPTL